MVGCTRPLLLSLAAIGLSAADWRAGVAQKVITPNEPIWLSGYEERSRPHEGVLRDLNVKALALEDETGHASLLVSADILGFTREAGAAVAERCLRQFGL